MTKSNLLEIPGIGKAFVKDFARIDIFSISDLADQNADQLFLDLCRANEMDDHKTSRNYLYVIRMAVYYANGGRDKSKLQWNAWKD
jgi:nucleotidyltransferase/DNA polymerase involved in DNA repair